MRRSIPRLTLAATALALGACAGMETPKSGMSFFVSSVGSGKGADFGGLAGADRHCQSLAAAAGAGQRTWRAYLSATPAGGMPAVPRAVTEMVAPASPDVAAPAGVTN